MTIKRITNTSLEANRVILRPQVEYIVSGSIPTGSIPLIPNPSPNIRVLSEVTPSSGPYNSSSKNLESFLDDVKEEIQNDGSTNKLVTYLNDLVPSSSLPAKNSKEFNIAIENIPGIQYYEESTNLPVSGSRGSIASIVNSILERDQESNRNVQFGFTNYNCLGFVSGSGTSTSSKTALIYRDNTGTGDFTSFCVGFWVKAPKNTSSVFRPATIFHIDNLITVSLVSGSAQDKFGDTNSFKIVSHLSSSNENRVDAFKYDSIDSIPDNNAVDPNFEKRVVFSPSDIIQKNEWNHVFVAVTDNLSSGYKSHSLFLNGEIVTGSITNYLSGEQFNRSYVNTSGHSNPHIVVGNKIENASDYDEFFVESYASNEMYSGSLTTEPSVTFESPLSGEVHDISFFTYNDTSISYEYLLSNRTTTLDLSDGKRDPNVDFYLPVLFAAVEGQYIRTNLNTFNISDSQTSISMSLSPHENFFLSNDIRFPEVNITSFLGAFSQDEKDLNYPRCVGMQSLGDISLDESYYSNIFDDNAHVPAAELSTVFTRNNLIRSCDNGLFTHDFDVVDSNMSTLNSPNQKKYFLSSSMGNRDISHVSMKNYLSESITFDRNGHYVDNPHPSDFIENKKTLSCPLFDSNIDARHPSDGFTPSLYAVTKYRHSNLVTIIDIPQMFYSKRIHPGTFEFAENNLTGSNGMLTYNIKDNGLGALYRNDSAVPDTFNKCGIILYELGIVILTHPSLCLVGKTDYSVKFKGEKDLNVLNVNAHIGKFEFNESSNISYNSIGKIGDSSNENEIVMITGIEYLDENLNVVMRSNLSQPVSKREFDEIMFRSRIDF